MQNIYVIYARTRRMHTTDQCEFQCNRMDSGVYIPSRGVRGPCSTVAAVIHIGRTRSEHVRYGILALASRCNVINDESIYHCVKLPCVPTKFCV